MRNRNRRITDFRSLQPSSIADKSTPSAQHPRAARDRAHAAARREFRSILVPLDGSLTAEHALPHALAIARRTGATVRVIHVHSRLDHVEPWQMSLSNETMERRKQLKRDYLQGVAQRISRVGEVRLKTALIESPEIEATLCEAAIGADLLIMASSRRSFFRRLWSGSIVEQLRQHVLSPMLLVRGYPYPVDLTGDPIPRHILLPLDGSELAERVIMPATIVGGLSNAALTLLNVQDEVWKSDFPDQVVPDSYLDAIAHRVKHKLPVVHRRILTTNGSIGSAVAGYAQQHLIDLIAMSTHHDGGVARFLRGSVADAIFRHTNVPILLTGTDRDSCTPALAVVG